MLPENLIAAMLIIQMVLNCIMIVALRRLEWQLSSLIDTLDLLFSTAKEPQDETPPANR